MELWVIYKDQQSFEVDLEWVTPDEDDIRQNCMDQWEERTEEPKPSEDDWYAGVTYDSDDDLVKHFIADGKIADFSELEEWVTSDTLSEGAKEAWLRNIGVTDVSEAEEAYYGRFDNQREFARDYLEEFVDWRETPTLLADNIDWDGVAADLMADFWEMNDYYFQNV